LENGGKRTPVTQCWSGIGQAQQPWQGFCNTLKTKETASSKLCFPQVSRGYSAESSFYSFMLPVQSGSWVMSS